MHGHDYRPTSWEVKETLDREEKDDVVIQQFSQSLVDKMMFIVKAAAIYEEPCQSLPDTHADEPDEIYDDTYPQDLYDDGFNVEIETYEDVTASMMSPPRPGLTKDENAHVLSTNTKVCIS